MSGINSTTDATQIWEALDQNWEANTETGELSRLGRTVQGSDPVSLEKLGRRLRPLAWDAESLLDQMAEERRRVEEDHPWRYGSLFLWLSEKVAVSGGQSVSRFIVFQQAGFWVEFADFNDFCTQRSGTQYSNWMGWIQSVRNLRAPQTKKIIQESGLTQQDFVSLVPMTKMRRANSRIAKGALEPHQVEGLLDPDVSDGEFRHRLRIKGEEWENGREERRREEREWVDRGDQRTKMWVEHDPGTGQVVLKLVDANTGELTVEPLARFSTPKTTTGAMAQDEMARAAIKYVEGLSNLTYEWVEAMTTEASGG